MRANTAVVLDTDSVFHGVDPVGHEHEAPYSFEELRVILHLSHPATQEDHASSEVNRMLAHTLDLPVLHARDAILTRSEIAGIRNSDDDAAVRAIVLELGETGANAVLPAFDTRPKKGDDDE